MGCGDAEVVGLLYPCSYSFGKTQKKLYTKWAIEQGVGPNPGHLSRGVAQIWDMLGLSIKPCMLRFKSGNGLG